MSFPVAPLPDAVAVDAGLAGGAGFTVPVFIAREVWDTCVLWREEDAVHTGATTSQAERLTALLDRAYEAAGGQPGEGRGFTVQRYDRTVTAAESAASAEGRPLAEPAVLAAVTMADGSIGITT